MEGQNKSFHVPWKVKIATVASTGAALGSIIQRGGFGWAFVSSVLLFLLHYVLTMVSEKLGRTWVLSPFWAIWGPNLALLPIALFMVWWASIDGQLPLNWIRRRIKTTA